MENSNDLSHDFHRESVSPYQSDNGLELILDESRTTSHSTFPRFCEKSRYPLGVLWIDFKAVAPVVIFLVSDVVRMVSGATYDVNAGDSTNF